MAFEYVMLANGWACEVPMRCLNCRKTWTSLLRIDKKKIRLKPLREGIDPWPRKGLLH